MAKKTKGKGKGGGFDIKVDLNEILKETAKTFTPGGCQTQMVIINKTDFTLARSGSHVGAGDVMSRDETSDWGPPTMLEPQTINVMLVDSDGGSSQLCAAYGLPVEDDRHRLMMFYAYNPKMDSHMYAGFHNPVPHDGTLSAQEWKDSRFDQGKYPGNTLCEDANDGTGPDWQKDVTSHPTNFFELSPLNIELRCSRKETDDGSRLVAIFTLTR